jgi:hypothetical protein
VLKCKLWNPSRISPDIEIPQGCTLVSNGLYILGVPMGTQNFTTHFLDEVLFQNVVYINDLLLLGDAQVVLGILSSCVIRQPFYLTQTVLLCFSFLSFLASFDKRVM